MRFGSPSALAMLAAVLGCAGTPVREAREPARELPRDVSVAALIEASPIASASFKAELPPVEIAWAYRAGAPLAAPPGVGADGTVALGSVDGYLHGLRPDGSFRWGFTLRGPLVGKPAMAPDGRVFAAANPNGLYALDADGTLLWASSVSGGVKSPPVVDRDRRVWVTTGQGTVLGFSARGGIVGFARVGSARTLGPAPLADGGVVIASVDGSLRIAGHPGAARLGMASAPVVGLEAAEDALLVLGADGLARFDTRAGEERWSRMDVARVACATPSLVVVEQQGLRWLSAQGEPKARVDVQVGAQRPIACLGDGSLLVPDDAGALLRVDATGVRARAKLPPGRLVSLDPTDSGLVIAGYRDGRVLALSPPAGS